MVKCKFCEAQTVFYTCAHQASLTRAGFRLVTGVTAIVSSVTVLVQRQTQRHAAARKLGYFARIRSHRVGGRRHQEQRYQRDDGRVYA